MASCTIKEDMSGISQILYDDVLFFKEVVFQSDSEEDFSEGKRLTSLVCVIFICYYVNVFV